MDETKVTVGQSKEKLWNRNYINLVVVNVFIYLSFFLVTPILSSYAIQLGATLALAGFIVGIFAITTLVLGPFGGVLTDRTNKKYIMIIGTLINAVATIGYSMSPNVTILILFRVIHGAGFSVTSATALAWITDYIPKKRLGEGIGYIGIAQIAATAFGPQLGITVSDRYGTPAAFLLAAILLFVGAICMVFVTSEQKTFFKPGIQTGERIRLSNIVAFEVLPLALIAGLFSMGSGLVSSFLVLLGDQRHIANVGLYFTVNAIFLVLTRPLSGRLYDRKGLSIVLYPALIFAVIEALLLGHATGLWMIILAAVFKAFGQGIAQPAIQAESINRLGSHKSGIASSTYYVGASLGQGFGPLVGGAMATHIGYEGMFNFSGIMLIIGIIGFTFYGKKDKKRKNSVIMDL